MAIHTLLRTPTGRQWKLLRQRSTDIHVDVSVISTICSDGIPSTLGGSLLQSCVPSCFAFHACLDRKLFPNAYQGFNGRRIRVAVKEVGFLFIVCLFWRSRVYCYCKFLCWRVFVNSKIMLFYCSFLPYILSVYVSSLSCFLCTNAILTLAVLVVLTRSVYHIYY